MVRRSLSCSLCLVVVAACQFDSTGSGFPQGGSVAEGPSASTSTAGDEDDVEPASEAAAEEGGPQGAPDDGDRGTTSDGAETTGDLPAPDSDAADNGSEPDEGPPPVTSATDPGHDDEGEAGEAEEGEAGEADDGGADLCPESFQEIYWMADGDVNAPMALVPTDGADQPEAAISEVENSGEVTVTIDLPCAGQYSVWGLVWDYDPGAWASPDPDSFYVDLGGGESLWRYGCQTTEAESGLSWQKLSSLAAQPCDLDYVVVEAPAAGAYEIRFRNREAGDGNRVAGIAAIAVSLDLEADPAALYEPY